MSRARGLLGAVAFVIAVVGVAGGAGDPGAAQTAAPLGLAGHYDVETVESPTPATGARFGSGLSAIDDVSGDGVGDLLVGEPVGDGLVHAVDPVTGEVIYSVAAPDPSTASGRAAFGFGSTTAAVDDVGSCTGGNPGILCPQNPIGAPDGVGEFVVGAQGVDPTPSRRDFGRAYVFDGATGALLKRVDMPAADAAEQESIAGSRPNFGRTVASPASPYPADAPVAVKAGDFDGGGSGDFVVGAFGYDENSTTHGDCPGTCARSGRAYVYKGEDVAGSDPGTTLAVPRSTIKNPMPQADDPSAPANTNTENFGGGFFPLGDVGKCNTDPGPGRICANVDTSTTPDGIPDIAIAAFRVDFPDGFVDSGVVWLFDGATGSILHRIVNPEPQFSALFGSTDYSTPVGDVGESVLPDLYIPSVGGNGRYVSEGLGWVVSGNFQTVSHRSVIALLTDPTPSPGGNFGTSSASIGDVFGDFHNEILIGSVGPRFPGLDQSVVNDVHVFSAITQEAVHSFEDPDAQGGSGFGSALAPLGDVNGDGFVDIAVTAPGFDGATVDEGRLYIFRSGTAPIEVVACPGFEADERNQVVGTVDDDVLTGSAGDDVVCGLGGDDVVRALEGDDVVIGGAGNDIVKAGDGSDSVLAGSGSDDVAGGKGADDLRGHKGADTLRGGRGRDVLNGGRGKDVCLGGPGKDRLRKCEK